MPGKAGLYLKIDFSRLIFKVHVQPRSSKAALAGLHGDALKIKLTAPPVHDAANRMCIQFLAKQFQIPRSSIQILSGHKHRSKQIECRFESRSALEGILQKLKKIESIHGKLINTP